MSLRAPRIARATLIVLAAVALGTMFIQAAIEVWRGKGAAVYQNAYGMQIYWVTVLTIAASLVTAFVAALAMRWWQHRDDRKIERLLNRRGDKGSNDAQSTQP